MDELEKMRKGYLWNDCEQYLEEQRVAKELLYDFNPKVVKPVLKTC